MGGTQDSIPLVRETAQWIQGRVNLKYGPGTGWGEHREPEGGTGESEKLRHELSCDYPNPGRELALRPPQPPTRSSGWGPWGPRPALHVPAPAAGSVLRVRQRRMKLKHKMQGARPPRSGKGILVPNKHQLLFPQAIPGPRCSSFCGPEAGEKSSHFFPLPSSSLTL